MSGEPVPAYIGLGSNLDDPRDQVSRALDELDALHDTRLIARSSLYASAPLGPPGQPDYINAVAQIATILEPLELLDVLQGIEQAHQRVRAERWGPRTLDLDLLLYADCNIDLPRLQVPHPQMHRREFVLRPLLEIAPELVVPGRGKAGPLLDECEDLRVRRI